MQDVGTRATTGAGAARWVAARLQDSRDQWRAPVLVALLGLTVLVVGAGRPAWSRDEAATVMVVRRPADQVWAVWAFDPALEPYYLAMNLWAAVSTAELWLRLPSILATASTAGLLVALATRLLTPAAGVLTGLFFLLIPAVTRYGQEARPYAFTMLFATFLVWCWSTPPTGQPGRRRRLALAGGVVGVGLMHAYALLMLPVLVLAVWLVPVRDRRREVLALLPPLALGVLVLTAFLWVVAHGARGAPVPAELTIANLAAEGLRLPAGLLRAPGAGLVGGMVLLAALTGVVIGLRKARTRRTAVLAALWVGLPPSALVTLQAVTGAPGLVTRYWTFCLPGLALAASPLLLAGWRRSRVVTTAALVAVAAATLPTQLAVRSVDGHAGRGWRDLTHLLDRPDLAAAAVLAENSTYRTLVANRPELVARLPLARDPGPTGRVLPQIAGRRSAEFVRLREQFPMVLALQNSNTTILRPPTARALTVFADELRVFSRPQVLCAYFGDPLGVFVRPDQSADPARARRIADLLTSSGRGQVACQVAG